MKRILCSLLVATQPFGSVLADASKEKNAKVTLVYQHELPNVSGKHAAVLHHPVIIAGRNVNRASW
jgi:hypothetical protein